MSLFDLTGKTAIITGSSRGIGKAIAEEMAAQGARVVISSRKAPACEETAAEINARFGAGTAIAIAANISEKSELEALVSGAREAFGPVDVLVCNAASNPYYGPMAGMTDEQFTKILQNNVISNHWLCQLVAPDMKARKDGAIVIVSSIAGIKGSPIIGAYGISKAADFQLARNLAVEWGRDNIRVNCVAPGLIKTDFAKALWENPDNLKRALATTPMARIGEPQEIAGAVVFLASKAGAYMTGNQIVIDGGATIS